MLSFEVPWTTEHPTSNPREISSDYSFGRLSLAKLQLLWPPGVKNLTLEKTCRKIEQEKKRQQRMDGWHRDSMDMMQEVSGQERPEDACNS